MNYCPCKKWRRTKQQYWYQIRVQVPGSFFFHHDGTKVQIDILLNPHEDDKVYYKTR